MRIPILAVTALSAALFIMPEGAQAQRRGEMTFFSNMSYSGARYTVTGPRENVSVPFQIRSVMVAPGERWEICSRTGYRDCIMVSENIANIRRTVASARPWQAQTPPEPGPAPGGGGSAGPSLRGMSAEFFRAPENRGQRVESRQGSATAASESADRFCRSRGWTASSYERLETVRGRNYLADVLCTRTR